MPLYIQIFLGSKLCSVDESHQHYFYTPKKGHHLSSSATIKVTN